MCNRVNFAGLLIAFVLISGCASIEKDGDGLVHVEGGPVMALTANVWVALLENEDRFAPSPDLAQPGTDAHVASQALAALGIPPILVIAAALDIAAMPLTVPIGWAMEK